MYKPLKEALADITELYKSHPTEENAELLNQAEEHLATCEESYPELANADSTDIAILEGLDVSAEALSEHDLELLRKMGL